MDNTNNDDNSTPPTHPSTSNPSTNPVVTNHPNNDTNGDNNNSTSNNNNRDQFLRHLTHLNKFSHKISKPTRSGAATGSSVLPEPTGVNPSQPQQQPPVYNINKSDFRDVVQKLTGSPAHASSSSVPAVHAPQYKPGTSSRLQRIRPPPLSQLSHRPPPLLSGAVQPNHALLSPLPPLPTCHAAAESPISAYMRFLHAQTAAMMFPPPANMENVPPPPNADESSSSGVVAAPPLSPLPFGCLPSPKSPCPRLSTNLLLPLSPTVSGVPSPKWRD